MSNVPGDNKTQNILIEMMASQGVTLKVRDRDQYMNASIEKRAAHLAKKEAAARRTTVSEIDEEGISESVDKFYSRGNKVD